MTPSYALGLCFILCVSLIWSLASIVVQYLYTDQDFDSPFLLTYIGTSLFILLLPSRILWEHVVGMDTESTPWKHDTTMYHHVPNESEQERSIVGAEMTQLQDDTDDTTIGAVSVSDSSLNRSSSSIQTAQGPHPHHFLRWSHHKHIRAALRIAPVWFVANWAYNASLAYTSITSSTVLASTGSLFTFLFAVLLGDERFSCLEFSGVLLGVLGSVLTGWHDMVTSSSSSSSSSSGTDHGGDEDMLLRATIANVTLNTAPSSAAAGHVGTPHHMFPSSNKDAAWEGHALWGDVLGLLSAVGYGGYAVMIRVLCPRDERCMSMQLLLGYIGLINALALSPLAVRVLVWPPAVAANNSDESDNHHHDEHTSGDEGTTVQSSLTWVVFGYLVAKGMLDNVLSDYLWARAVVLTSATVATVGLGLTIPLAFASDWVMGHRGVASVQSVLGALSVLVGFVLVNLGLREESPMDDADLDDNDDDDSGEFDQWLTEMQQQQSHEQKQSVQE